MTRSYGEYADAVERLTAHVMQLEDVVALCVEALEAVEWTDAEWCEWCKRHEADGHFTDCLRERALAAAKGVSDGRSLDGSQYAAPASA